MPSGRGKPNRVNLSLSNWAMGGSLLSISSSPAFANRIASRKNRHSSDSGFEDNLSDDGPPAKQPPPTISSKKSSGSKKPAPAPAPEVSAPSATPACVDCNVKKSATEKCVPACPVCNQECVWEKHMHEKYGQMTCPDCRRGQEWLMDEFHKGRGEYGCEKCTPDCKTCGRGPVWLNKKWKKTLRRKVKVIQGDDGKKKEKSKDNGENEKNQAKDEEEKNKAAKKAKEEGEAKAKAKAEKEAKEAEKVKEAEKAKEAAKAKEAEKAKKAEKEKEAQKAKEAAAANGWTTEKDAKLTGMKAVNKTWKAISLEVDMSKDDCIERFRDLKKKAESEGEKKDEATPAGTQDNSGGGREAGFDIFGDGWGSTDPIVIEDTSGKESGRQEKQNKSLKKEGGKKKNKGNKQGKDAGNAGGGANQTSGGDGWGNTEDNTQPAEQTNTGWGGDGWGDDGWGNTGDDTQPAKQTNTGWGDDGWGNTGDNTQSAEQTNTGWGASGNSGDNTQAVEQNNSGWGKSGIWGDNNQSTGNEGWGAVNDTTGADGGNKGGTGNSWSKLKPTPPPGGYFMDSNPTGKSVKPGNAVPLDDWGAFNSSWVELDPSTLDDPPNTNSGWGGGAWASKSKDTSGNASNNGNRNSNLGAGNNHNPSVYNSWNQAGGSWNRNSGNGAGNSPANSQANTPDTPKSHKNSRNEFSHHPGPSSSHWNSTDGGRGGLQPSNLAWTADDCTMLGLLEQRHREEKWARIKADFYNCTGRMIPAELIENEFRATGAS
ncbi:hypothetical protein MBM_07115 [Drepanopeziza brunnea f. sp. 'multigermtubi' MB_m1]|uniref:Myb-like domain-containing protein n=1 Tax=Marssonina brunnea f. sp. multigermtubi (strain MB_m1) TaxID=1072389 RepID=K1XQM4_MARBU|nr:uncharacterized protein MBM_07115 [Drepanopeziza brunnea f. sp. 'multigermtubi' MB_m1]EKD14904.1 hypothetical protein MBM_07115 [Drepanopeziza brunnea f. sp. 'multigermtubi' MB_m1]